MRRALIAALVVSVAATAGSAAAQATSGSPEQQLADKYAPIVALKKQEKPCDSHGEPYRPVPVDVVLGKQDVSLVDSNGKLIRKAPTAADLYGRGVETYLDFPGSPLSPGCSYERWAKAISLGEPTTAYAHVVAQPGKPGKLALQYWLYYVFNDWNNKHESDWEMVQLMFDATSASDALTKTPTEIGYSQHDGAERAAWHDKKLQKRGTHPIVYPARGSHANFFTPSLWLGHSAQEGFGCDDTRGPSRMEQTHAVLLPDGPVSRSDRFAWLAFDGRWGQKEHGPNTGPDGPNTKPQWTKPVTWAEDTWRSGSTQVPLRSTIGPSATDFFCGAVAAGSRVYLRFLRTPWFVVAFVGLLVLLALWLSRRTRWSPVRMFPIDQPRAGGQIYRTARAVYRLHPGLFVGIGLMFVPLGILAALLQDLLALFTGFGNFLDESSTDPVITGVIALLFGELSTIVASVFVTAAIVVALETMERGALPTVRASWRGVLPHGWALGWAWLRVIVVAVLLSLTVVGIPLAIFYLVRKVVLTQACVSEHLGSTAALRRSSHLVGRHVLRVFAIASLVNVTAFLLGPIVGVVVLFTTSSSLVVINLISSLVYVVVIPYAGIAIALLFYDLRRRAAGEEPVVSPRVSGEPIASH